MNIDRAVVMQVLDALYLWHMTDGETKELMPAFNALRDAFIEADSGQPLILESDASKEVK